VRDDYKKRRVISKEKTGGEARRAIPASIGGIRGRGPKDKREFLKIMFPRKRKKKKAIKRRRGG